MAAEPKMAGRIGGTMRRKTLFVTLIAVLSLSAGVTAHAQSPSPLRPAGAIPLTGVEGRIDHMAFDRDHNRLYVAALGNNTVEAIDLAAGKAVGRIAGLKKPQGICVLPG